MAGALAVVSAALSLAALPTLPVLPAQGVALESRTGVALLDLHGRRLAQLAGFRFVSGDPLAQGLPRLRDRAGRSWRLDAAARRLVRAEGGTPLAGRATLTFVSGTRTWLVEQAGRVVLRIRVGREFPFLSEDRDVVSTARRALDLTTGRFLRVPRGCIVASRRVSNWILLCGRVLGGTLLPTSIEELANGRRKRIVGAPTPRASDGRIHGHWLYALASSGGALLAQWSGECEVPTAFLIEGGKVRPFGGSSARSAPESAALGWLADGGALIHFPVGACGGSFRTPGVYAVPRGGKPRLVVPTRRGQRLAMWGG